MGDAAERVVFTKITRRLLPFLFVLYLVCFLDRVNVGFAELEMGRDLGFSDLVYGFGAGVFFLGYALFEVPSNLILERVGARRWIARIMITWGLLAAGMMFIRTPLSFYILRFLLGLAEAGFYPGVVLYLTYWFPQSQRARTTGLFLTAVAISGVVGGPLSGSILALHGAGGLAGWQWLFLLEGLPATLLGIVVFFYLPDGPQTAHWLTPAERDWLLGCLAEERQEKERRASYTVLQTLASGRVWAFALLAFLLGTGFYGVSLWLPEMIRGFSGLGDTMVGVVSAVPYLAAATALVIIGHSSDHRGERRWHVAGPAFLAAVGLVASAYVHQPVLALLALSVAAAGIEGALGPFWAMPTAFLTGSAAAAGIALINSVGNLSGFVGPFLIGVVKEASGSFSGGLLVLAGTTALAGCVALLMPHEPEPEPSPRP